MEFRILLIFALFIIYIAGVNIIKVKDKRFLYGSLVVYTAVLCVIVGSDILF